MFGEKLKEARAFKGLKQNELATLLNLSNTTVNNWERNISKPDIDTLQSICDTLDVDPNYFFDLLRDHSYNPQEELIIKKYRSLDAYGKKAIESTLDLEYQRVHASFEDKHFDDAEEAYAFITKGQMYAMGGLDIESMNQEELIDFANDIYDMEQKAAKYFK